MIRALVTVWVVILAVPAWAEIRITSVTSPGGITAWLVEDHTVPIISLEASFGGGTVLDPPGQEGVTTLMTALLEEGAGARDATAFAEAREDLATRFGFDASLDAVNVSAEMLAENRDASVALLREALVAPRLDAAAVERVRGQLLARLRDDATDPDRIATHAFYAELFPGHAYARPSDGTIATVERLDVGDLRAAHARALTRDRLKVAIAGAITPAELGPLLDRLFGGLTAAGPPLPPVIEVRAPGTVTVIELDVPQSVVVFGHQGIPRKDPDFIPAFVMDHILGGAGFGSRLTEEIREKRGLTYGIYTYLAPKDLGWLYMGRFASANGRVAEALGLLRAEWGRMAREGVTEAELLAAKRYLTGAYPLRFTSNGAISGQLLALQTAKLPNDYVNIRNDLVEAVTVEDIRRVARRVLQPDALTMVIVGRPEGVTATN